MPLQGGAASNRGAATAFYLTSAGQSVPSEERLDHSCEEFLLGKERGLLQALPPLELWI